MFVQWQDSYSGITDPITEVARAGTKQRAAPQLKRTMVPESQEERARNECHREYDGQHVERGHLIYNGTRPGITQCWMLKVQQVHRGLTLPLMLSFGGR